MKRYQKTADFRKPVPSKGAQVVFLSALLVIIFAVTILKFSKAALRFKRQRPELCPGRRQSIGL
jgi:hypothetical protein